MSPRQNRVTPTGEIIATPTHGLFMGNRGCLHDGAGLLGTARWRHPYWVCCVLAFKGRRRPLMQPNRYTELFFLDEAVALAAGHRPCAECRRADFDRFRAAFGEPSAPRIDAALHAARVTRTRHQITFTTDCNTLPDGAFVRSAVGHALVLGSRLLPYTPGGYGPAIARPSGPVEVLTPRPTVAALAAGYAPVLHPSAG